MSIQDYIAIIKLLTESTAFFGFLTYLIYRIFRYLEFRVAAHTGNEIVESTKKRSLRFFRSKTALAPPVAASRHAPKVAPPTQPEPERQATRATVNHRPRGANGRRRR